jgi:hypothetical protein
MDSPRQNPKPHFASQGSLCSSSPQIPNDLRVGQFSRVSCVRTDFVRQFAVLEELVRFRDGGVRERNRRCHCSLKLSHFSSPGLLCSCCYPFQFRSGASQCRACSCSMSTSQGMKRCYCKINEYVTHFRTIK